ncbi:MAG TPA: ABC transporter substrate-binding protein, partial [Rhodobacteraceae bacterium]|nr:ABC transporter substrate-binding protein [Paracoccaceae bacterium]
MKFLTRIIAAVLAVLPAAAFAACDTKYTTKEGDTLFSIAE